MAIFPGHESIEMRLGQKSRLGFYFHIPFCAHICPYCDFTKTGKFSKADTNQFFNRVKLQLDGFLRIAGGGACTVYFGGGTPSLFDAETYVPILQKIAEKFSMEEVTIETNPHTNFRRQLEGFQKAGFTRITLGAQSLCNETLKILGRRHTNEVILKNIENARTAGFEEIQVDLIYGLKKGIRRVALNDEVTQILNAGASGISGYALTLEKRTQFANSDLASGDSAADEYPVLHEACLKNGLHQIETSNFSKFEAKHNNIYWHGMPYFGIGTGAHGLLPPDALHPYGERYRVGDIPKERAPGDDDLDFSNNKDNLFAIVPEEPRTKEHYIDEMIFTLLRTPDGIPIAWLDAQVGQQIRKRIFENSKIHRALENGQLKMTSDAISLAWQEQIRGDSWALDLCALTKG